MLVAVASVEVVADDELCAVDELSSMVLTAAQHETLQRFMAAVCLCLLCLCFLWWYVYDSVICIVVGVWLAGTERTSWLATRSTRLRACC